MATQYSSHKIKLGSVPWWKAECMYNVQQELRVMSGNISDRVSVELVYIVRQIEALIMTGTSPKVKF